MAKLKKLLCRLGLHRWQRICHGFFDRCSRCDKLRAWYERPGMQS